MMLSPNRLTHVELAESRYSNPVVFVPALPAAPSGGVALLSARCDVAGSDAGGAEGRLPG
jgi:hypothetical protein